MPLGHTVATAFESVIWTVFYGVLVIFSLFFVFCVFAFLAWFCGFLFVVFFLLCGFFLFCFLFSTIIVWSCSCCLLTLKCYGRLGSSISNSVVVFSLHY